MAENRLPAPDPEAWLRVSSCPGRCQKSSQGPGKWPFCGKSFYLDLPAGKNLQFLTEAIQELGGVIEGFLSKEVSCIVSNRREAKGESGGMKHRGCPSPSEVRMESFSMDDPRDSHTKTSQKRKPLVPLSRGQELLQKAIRNQRSSAGGPSGSSSLLTNARSWGVKVLHVDEMMAHVQQLSLSSCVKKQEPKKPQGTRPGSESRTRKVVRLKAPFLKIEDVNKKFRPSHHQFKSFPEISFLGPKDASPFEALTTPDSFHHTRGLKDLEPCLQSAACATPRRRKGFCECCQVAFTELHLHLQSAQHQSFALDPSPYAEVDRIIAQLSHSLALIPSQASLPRQSGSLDSECDLLYLETPPPSQLSHPKAASAGMKKEDGSQGPDAPEQNRTVDSVDTPAESAGTGELPGLEVSCQEPEGPVDMPVVPPRTPVSKNPVCPCLLTSSTPVDFSDPDLAFAGRKRKVQFHSGNAEKKPGPFWSHASVCLPRAPSPCSAKTTGSRDGLSLCLPGREARPLSSPLPFCCSKTCLSLPGPFPWQPLDSPAEFQITQSPKPGGGWPLESKGPEHIAPDLILEQAAQLPSCSTALGQHSAAGGPSEVWSPYFPTVPASMGAHCSQWFWDSHSLQIPCLPVPQAHPSLSAGPQT